MQTPAATVVGDLESPADVIAFARDRRAAADRAEAERLQAAVVWADQHEAESLGAAEVFVAPGFWGGAGESAIPIAGPGAPLVAEFSVAEFAAAVGMTTEAGKGHLGEAIELRYRLPRLWKRVVRGDLPGWMARRVARETIGHAQTTEAAAYVDRHLAPVAPGRHHHRGPAGGGGDRQTHAGDRRPRPGRGDLYLSAGAAVPAPSPAEDPRRLVLHHP